MNTKFKFIVLLSVVVVATRSERCVLPEYPKNGRYTVVGALTAAPGDELDSALMNTTCDPGYTVSGKNMVYCVNAQWSNKMPRCVAVPTTSSPALSAELDEEDMDNSCSDLQWRCRDGSCISLDGQCDSVKDCPDGSDEDLPACSKTQTTSPPKGDCVLPSYPEDGSYVVSNVPSAAPGQVFDSLRLNVTCRTGFGVIGESSVFCSKGVWFAEIPKCNLFCKLNSHPSVTYNCLVSGSTEERPCRSYEPSGTIIKPECNAPNYYTKDTLPSMKCADNGKWDKIVTCLPAVTQNGTNITVLIKDKLEVYISGIEFAGVVKEGVNEAGKPAFKIINELTTGTKEEVDQAATLPAFKIVNELSTQEPVDESALSTDAARDPNTTYIYINNVINSSLVLDFRDQRVSLKDWN